MNIFKKYCESVYVAETDDKYEKGDIITLTTKRGKEVECKVHNLVLNKNDKFYYSIERIEDLSYAERKAERYGRSVELHREKSAEWHEKSMEARDFLSLGEPIKVGHHSEKRHRALIARNNNRMANAVKESEIADKMGGKAEYWAKKAKEINLSMPESLEYYTCKLEAAKKRHKGLKDGSIERKHSYDLQYARKAVKDLTRKVEIANKLWSK